MKGLDELKGKWQGSGGGRNPGKALAILSLLICGLGAASFLVGVTRFSSALGSADDTISQSDAKFDAKAADAAVADETALVAAYGLKPDPAQLAKVRKAGVAADEAINQLTQSAEVDESQ